MTDLLWILCVLLIPAAGGDSPCPEGAQVHLSNLRCYWLSETTSSWFEAQESCREIQGGDLAATGSLELQNFIHHSFSVRTSVWVWVKEPEKEGSEQAGVLEPSSRSEGSGGCTLMALGTLGQWTRSQCAELNRFLCDKQLTGILPTIDSYLTGLVLMTGVYARTQTHPLLNVPDTGQRAVELQLFPGLWFSHAGQLVTVELVVRPSPVASLARVQILRPYCDPNLHLVPPGCSSLLNPFNCCTAVPLCNTTGGCSMGQYWCHLLDTCVPTSSPCSPYDSAAGARGFKLPPRYLETPPFYHMVADLPLRVEPSSGLKTINLLLPDQAIVVYPDDVVAIQHTRSAGDFLHCLQSEASVNSPWRQSYVSFGGPQREGWWRGGLTSLSQKGQWVDGVVCDLKMLYVDNLQRATEQDDVLGSTPTTIAPDIRSTTLGPSTTVGTKFGLDVIHPVPDEKNQIHVQVNVPTLLAIKVLTGGNARSWWSRFPEAWFSSVTLVMPSAGAQTLNITVMNEASSESLTLIVCSYEAVAGLSVEPHGRVRMLVGVAQSFTAKLRSGSSVKFSWATDNLESFAHEGETYSVLLKTPAEYRLKVTASNPVSAQSEQLLLAVEEMEPLSGPEFVFVQDVVAVNATHSYHLRVKADVSLPVTFRWDFGAGDGRIISSHSAPCQTTVGLIDSKMRQVYVQDSVNYTYTSPDDYTLHVQVVNEYQSAETSVTIRVRPQLSHAFMSSSPLVPFVGQTLFLGVSVAPPTCCVFYTWDFGDGSRPVQVADPNVSHAYGSAGLYNVTVCANNTVSALTAWLLVEVMEKVSGLTVSASGPSELGSATDFRAEVATGTGLIWIYDFGDGSLLENQTVGSASHIYKTPGIHTVDVTALNAVSAVRQSVTVEVYRLAVTGLLPTECVERGTDAELLALVNGNVSVLRFQWQFGDGSPSTVVTGRSSATHSFPRPGSVSVNLTVFSSAASASFSASICVQEEVQGVDFHVDAKTRPFFISSGVTVPLCGFHRKGSDLHWNWTVIDPEDNLLTASNPTFLYSFSHAGIYQVSLNVSNQINWQVASHTVVVQDTVEGLCVNISKSSLCADDTVTFIPTVSRGSNTSFAITLRNKDWSHNPPSATGRFTTSHLPVGSNLVTIKAWNQVSREELSTSVQVLEHVQGLKLVDCCSVALEAEKGTHFKADVERGFPVNYTWTFHMRGSGTTSLTGPEVFFTPEESGCLSVRVAASNGGCSSSLNLTLTVQRPVAEIKLVCYSERVFAQHAVRFVTTVDAGTDLRLQWDFGDYSESLVTESNSVNHTYASSGHFMVTVTVFNSVSRESTQLHLKVEDLQCSSPQASVVQSQSAILRSRPSVFEASVSINCSAYEATYLWEIYTGSSCTSGRREVSGSRVRLGGKVETTSPLLLVPQKALAVGRHCLVFTVSLLGSPLYVQRKANITVIHSPLVASIKGGSHRLWSSLSDLILDGSQSQDPDAEPGEEDALQYQWTSLTAVQNSTESRFLHGPTGSSSKMTVVSSRLLPDTEHIFTLTVYKRGRSPASANQTVMVRRAPLLPVTVDCLSCSSLSSTHRHSYTNTLVLAGHCGRCSGNAQYKWTAQSHTGVILDLEGVTTSTGTCSPNLVVRSGVLQLGLSYTFTLNVSLPGGGQWGVASLFVQPNNPPHGGRCDLSPESDVRLLDTLVTYSCSGWQDDESEASQLIYSLQVASCQNISNVCPILTLYRGVRSTFSSMVPTGDQSGGEDGSAITVLLLVEDHLGAKVTALNRTLTVKNPTRDEFTTQWLKSKSQNELRVLVQHGNPQEIIPYSIILTRQLNKMQSTQSVSELRDRRSIRENVTQALASLPTSSMMHVDLISSALAQATSVPSELVSKTCHKLILKSVGKMIRVMDDHSIPGASSASHTGWNILKVLGNTLAAVSEATRASSDGSSLHSASTLALSALSYTGDLMRSLMRSRVHWETPLSLSSPHVSAVGYHGDPSHLLCTHQWNQPSHHPFPFQGPSPDRSNGSESCPFHIPDALVSRLMSRAPDAVQVLIVVDNALESVPLLTGADPPVSTSLVAMELTTPRGRPIRVADLEPEQAIRVTLPNKYPVKGGDRTVGQDGNGTCFTVTVAAEEQLTFAVKAPDELDEDAGLYLSFNFSLVPGGSAVRLGHVRIEVSSSVQEPDASQNSLVREWDLTLSPLTPSTEKTIFLSPLVNGTDQPLSVNLTSSSVDGGPVRLSLCVFSSVCQFYSVSERRWSSEGLRPLDGSTLHTVHCLTQHLTMFGASLFVHPGAVVLLQPSAGPVRNMVVGIVCVVLVLIHLLVGLIAHKLDHLDDLRLSQVPLCGRPGLYHYRVLVKTGWRRGAGTSAHVGISLYGVNKSGSRHLLRDGAFQRGGLDQFHVETDDNLGEVWKIRIWHDNTGLDPSWYIQHVVVWDPQTDHLFYFELNDWLSVENEKNGAVEREVLASCPEELSGFRRVLASQLMFGMRERHMWLSLMESPGHSRFSRVQRAGCSATVLLLYLALGALWYGAVGTEGLSGPVSTHLLVNMETVAVGMTLALLVFPLQCFLGFLFRKAQSKVTADVLASPSPVCQSVEMDVHLGQSVVPSPSFISLPDSYGPIRGSSTSLLESKGVDSSILDFWAASGLAPRTHNAGLDTWSSCESIVDLPLSSCQSKTSPAYDRGIISPAVASSRPLRRKKAVMELCPVAPSAPVPSSCKYHLLKYTSDLDTSSAAPGQEVLTMTTNQENHNLTRFLTLSEEDLLMSIAAAEDFKSSSDSGWDSPRTTSSLSTSWSASCSSWSDHSEEKLLFAADVHSSDPKELHRCPSVLSVNSVASTFLPSPPPDSARSSSSTRIGVARGRPSWLLPSWALCVVYPLMAVLLGASLAVTGLYGSFFSRSVVLMWLVSALCAFLTSAVLLEPLKVCVQALICTVLWRPVDPEVDEQLARETTVVSLAFGERSKKVRPPCGYGLLQAKEQARKVQALRSLMRRCVCQLLFLMLVLMVNYQDRAEQSQGRMLHSWVRRCLHTSLLGGPNLTSLTDWTDVEQWVSTTLVQHLHRSPSLRLVGRPQLQYSRVLGPAVGVVLGNSSDTTHQVLTDLHDGGWSKNMVKSVSLDFTQYHTESGLFVCVSLQLVRVEAQRFAPSLLVYPLLIPSSVSGLDLQVALTVLLFMSALLILLTEIWSMATERAQYLRQCRHWLQLLLASLSLATALLQLSFLSVASSCVSELQSRPDAFISFHSAALQAQRSSQCAAVLLTVLVLKLLRTFRFVRRWVVIGRVLQRSCSELWAAAVLLLVLLLLCIHLGNTLFSRSVGGFTSAREAAVSVLALMRGRVALHKLCRTHPALGPLYGLLLLGGVFWLVARLCGAVLVRTYREERAELFYPPVEPQDYEMVEFFIKRLKLWVGLTKTREFRHRVTFEGMDVAPSRSSQESRLSTASSLLHCSRSPSSCSSGSSPCSLSSALSVRSAELDVQPPLDRLAPCVTALLSQFDRVNQVNEEVHDLEMKLEEARIRKTKKKKKKSGERFGESQTSKEQEGEGAAGEVRRRRTGVIHPRQRVSLPSCFPFSTPTFQTSDASSPVPESDSVLPPVSGHRGFEATTPESGIRSLRPAASLKMGQFPRRRAWHSGSSHSADAAQRAFLFPGGAVPRELTLNIRPRSEEGARRRISDGAPVKRKAWISEGPEANG